MQRPIPLTRDIVLIGGGHTHALVLRKWGMDPLPGVRLTVIDPNPTAPYSGMLPGHIAGHYSQAELELDLVRLARFAGARLVIGRAEGLDLARQTVRISGRPPIAYDLASVDIGITSNLPELPGFAEHGLAAKPLGALSDRWAEYLEACAKGDKAAAVAVIGAGVAGAELALAMMHAMRTRGLKDPVVNVIEAAEPLTDLTAKTRAALLAQMQKAGIGLLAGTKVQAVEAGRVQLDDGQALPATLTIGTAGARPYGWLEETGLALSRGFINVDATLRSSTSPQVFAVGDCAHLTHAPRPKAGVYAVREAPVLFDNLRASVSGGKLRRYQPQKDYLKLISLGDKRALADKFGFRTQGAALWRLKDRIDRKFMRKFHALPSMPQPDLPRVVADGVREMLSDQPPLCGGCGAKMAMGSLRGSLSALPATARDDVLSGPGDDAAILQTGGETQVFTTDHLRAFGNDYSMMARIVAVHSLGDIWAMGAQPQAALASITLPQMRPKMQKDTLREILAAAGRVMTGAGAEIVGGHTTLGQELSIGFSVTGLCRNRPPITLQGAKISDALILTKPLGSGVLMAAEMQMQADGRWIAAALEEMARPNAEAARILARAHAMTDVTGFGLVGHLLSMLDAAQLGARVDLGAIPLMAGAVQLAERGIRSSIFAENRSDQVARVACPDSPLADLLFDPQTAGGLLAAVDCKDADAVLAQLQDAGYPAAQIGEIVAGPAEIRVV